MKRESVKRYLLIITGVVMVAFAISVFYMPNKIVSGGVSGVSVILYYTLGIPAGLSFAVINILLLLFAFFSLGKRFVADTVISSMLLSAFVHVFSYVPPVTEDVFLASVFGAFLYGTGIGLTLIEGASTGGTDILSRLLQKRFVNMKIGTMLLCVDFVVIFTSLLIFRKTDLALYGIVALGISSFSVNWLIQKLNISKLAFVVSEKGNEISEYLVSNSPRGVTICDVVGGYTMDEKKMLICALKENEMDTFQKRILEKDSEAFVIFSESQQIVGNGFRVYK